MKALVIGTEVVQVEQDADIFDVAPEFSWVDCDNSIKPYYHTYVDASFVAPTVSTDVLWQQLRGRREDLLLHCDWTQASDSPLSSDKKTEWATYRQAVRNLPANTADPSDVTWPDEPS